MSNGPLGSAFPQSQGLAMSDKLAGKNRVTVVAISDGASMEGEAKEAFAAIPGLASRGQVAPYILIISDNNTKLSGRIDKESFSMDPTFASLETLGWKVLRIEDGHDLQKCYQTMEQAYEWAMQNPQKPVAIHAKTIKGIGTAKTAESSSGAHGFPLKVASELPAFLGEIWDQKTLPAEFTSWINDLVNFEKTLAARPKTALLSATTAGAFAKGAEEKVQTGVAKAMIKARKNGWPVVSVTSDLPGSTGVAAFRKEFPQDSFDVGVAESNMVSVAAGFSRNGYIPFVDTFAQFGVTKGALPLIMASLSHSPIIAIYSHTGFQDAADGASHQALSYIAMTSAIPHVRTYCLSCSDEAEALVYQAMEEFVQAREKDQVPFSYVFFLGRENFPRHYGVSEFKLNKGQILFDNTADFPRSVTLAVGGSLVREGFKAVEALAQKNVGVVLVNPSIMNEPDVPLLQKALDKTQGHLVTVEDHQLHGGMGSLISHALSQNGTPYKLKSLGVKMEFGQSAYQALELYQKHNLDADAMVRTSLSFFN
jgi:transketolase